MAKSTYLPGVLPVLAICFCLLFRVGTLKLFAQEQVKLKISQIRTTAPANLNKRLALVSVFKGEVGVREFSGMNDGRRVETYLKYVNLSRGNPWCAAFVCWCLGRAGALNPRSGYCPDLFRKAKVVWSLNRPETIDTKRLPLPGDVFGIYFSDRNRVAHVGFIDTWGETAAVTVEGNTNEAGLREGDGVYRKRRPIRTLYQVVRYIE